MVDGLPQVEGGKHLREIVPAIKKLWEGDYEHRGELWSFPSATSTPKPVQKPHPPLWVAAPRRQDLRLGCQERDERHDDGTRLSFAEVENLLGKYATALANNHGAQRQRFMTSRMTCVYEDPKDWMIPVTAMRESVQIFMGLFNNNSPVDRGIPAADQAGRQRLARRLSPRSTPREHDVRDPDEVVAKLRRYEAAGIDVFNYNANFGLPHDQIVRSLKLFIDEVMPHFTSTVGRPTGPCRSPARGPDPLTPIRPAPKRQTGRIPDERYTMAERVIVRCGGSSTGRAASGADVSLVVEDGRIQEVVATQPDGPPPAAEDPIRSSSAARRTVMPGMMDLHVHFDPWRHRSARSAHPVRDPAQHHPDAHALGCAQRRRLVGGGLHLRARRLQLHRTPANPEVLALRDAIP